MRGFKRANQQGKLLIQFHSDKSEELVFVILFLGGVDWVSGGASTEWQGS